MVEADRQGFALFEVPYEMPFIAITEKAFGRLVNEQYEVLQRGIAVHRRLEQLVLEQRGLGEVPKALSAAIGGAVVLLDRTAPRWHPRPSAARFLPRRWRHSYRGDRAQRSRDGPAAFEPAHDEVVGRARTAGRSRAARPRVWLVAIRDGGGLGEFERLILQQAVTVVALELMRRRVVQDTERRLAGDVLDEVVEGEPRRGRAAGAAASVRDRGPGRGAGVQGR